MVKVAKLEQFYGDGAAVQIQKRFAALEDRIKTLEATVAVMSKQVDDLIEKLEEIRKAFVKQQKGAKSGS